MADGIDGYGLDLIQDDATAGKNTSPLVLPTIGTTFVFDAFTDPLENSLGAVEAAR